MYEYDAPTKKLRLLVDLRKVLKLPEGHYTPGKVHSRIDLGDDGWVYFATHRGSTRVTTDAYHYRGDWILRVHPASGRTEVVAHAPVGKQCIPCSVLDPGRGVFYGSTQAGDTTDKRHTFFAYDVKARKLLYRGYGGPARYLILARSTGRVYFVPDLAGKLHRYDPSSPGGTLAHSSNANGAIPSIGHRPPSMPHRLNCRCHGWTANSRLATTPVGRPNSRLPTK